jgi:hypothetical protein
VDAVGPEHAVTAAATAAANAMRTRLLIIFPGSTIGAAGADFARA